MEVVFKLDQEQLARARAIVQEVEKEDEDLVDPEGDGEAYCGNLLGWSGGNLAFNPNQHLELNEDASTITYKGERHPLEQDGGLTVLWKVVVGEIEKFPGYSWETHLRKGWCDKRREAVKKLRVVLYRTSDTRMEWHETMWDLAARMSPEELLEELITGRKTGGWQVPPAAVAEYCRPFLEKYRGVEPGTPRYRQMLASGQQVD